MTYHLSVLICLCCSLSLFHSFTQVLDAMTLSHWLGNRPRDPVLADLEPVAKMANKWMKRVLGRELHQVCIYIYMCRYVHMYMYMDMYWIACTVLSMAHTFFFANVFLAHTFFVCRYGA